MLLFEQWYRKYGVRLPQHLLSPILTPITELELPKQSVLHWPGTGSTDYGPASDELIFKNIQRPIPVWYAPDLIVKEGGPRKIIQNFEDSIRQWQAKNRRYRRVRDYALGVRDQSVPLVCNYTYPFRTYMYVRSIYANYNRVMNVHRSMWLQIRERLDGPENHFVFYALPKLLPGLSDLKLFSKAAIEERNPIPQQLLKRFGTIEATLLGELWKWAGTERSLSWWGGLTNQQLRKVNLILQQNGQWCVLNLGILNDLRQSTKQEAEIATAEDRVSDIRHKGLRADQIRLFLIRGWISLSGLKSDAGATVDTEVVKPVTLPVAPQPAALNVKPEPQSSTVLPIQPPVTTPPATSTPTPVATIATVVEPVVATQSSIPGQVDQLVPSEQAVLAIEADLERDLAALDALNQRQDSAEQAGVGSSNFSLPPDEAVKKLCDQLADQGYMTAAEYRRFTTLADSYKTIPAPEGDGTLAEFIKVPPELLDIRASHQLRDNPNVPDKTMLKSRLIEFDERYVKEVLQRDVGAMVLNVQQAGVCVTGFTKERVENILGAYDTYLVKVNPIEGAPSNLRFKLPAVEDDGTFMSNGVKYRLRKQLTEPPIRKVRDDQVALTSYYGKLFINRSEKRVNDWGRWLRRQVMLKGLDELDDSVTNLRVGNVFDPHFKAPRLFSTLAQDFVGFTSQGYDLVLDRKEARQRFKPEDLQRLEVDGSVILGQDQHGRFLVVDSNDALYKAEQGQLEPLGSIEQFLLLPLSKVPLDFVELKVMGKTIPLALVLGHELGLDRLCQLLNVVPRRVPAGKRVELTDFEYALVFSDETLVFNREDRQASLILAGFNEYHRALRDYPSSEFDREDVYLNVLETNGLGARYLRELELLYKLFVDPITKDLLIEMGEPVDFRGLLLRSAELLMLDYYPEKQERVRGYERLAGAVYSEIVRAIRSQRARPGRSRLPIDLNPYAVWKNIAQDPSVSLVSEINPIQNLKEQEAVTYSGTGGRGSRSMTRETRVFRESDMGVISEATVDSGDVGVNMYLTADPKWRSLRGMSIPYDHSKPDLTSLFSTSALLSPASDRDDQLGLTSL